MFHQLFKGIRVLWREGETQPGAQNTSELHPVPYSRSRNCLPLLDNAGAGVGWGGESISYSAPGLNFVPSRVLSGGKSQGQCDSRYLGHSLGL